MNAKLALAVGLFTLALGAAPALATTVTVQDTYIGPTITGTTATDSYGGSSYDIRSMSFSRDASNNISATISTNFAGRASSSIGYGDLLFGAPGATTSGWRYAVDMSSNPGTASGTVRFLRIADSNLARGTNRTGVFAQVGNTTGVQVLGTGTWSATLGSALMFSFNDGGILGNEFQAQWTQTCGNDVINGLVQLPSSSTSSTSTTSTSSGLTSSSGVTSSTTSTSSGTTSTTSTSSGSTSTSTSTSSSGGQVPVPGGLALIGGLLGVLGLRRKARAA